MVLENPYVHARLEGAASWYWEAYRSRYTINCLPREDLCNEGDDAASDNWRVVVTKHVVDHNHNLSKELYEHYRENRRIYDPELLAIDTSSDSAVVKRILYQFTTRRKSAGI
ncbi:Hypothetical protein PHPALM_8300 [Phytophthora palmivora]|uniref:Uncharacterized protein n=1 Tax=Phytophthora palmivora TaxID=4796 RepID=A0A2P4YA77_9STRA|nr:Hypothetical protein PHPALM_8300 [Phytophthora palmivora]